MGSKRRIVLKTVSLLLAFAVLQVYVLVNPAKASDTSNSAPSSMRFGQLVLSGNQSALVNGTNAASGTTILSGAHLQTLEGVTATVQLGTLGQLAIDPNTSLFLTFDKETVDVRVTAGNAILTTSTGVKGTLTTPEGEKLATNASANSTAGRRAAAKAFPGGGGGDMVLGFILTAAVVTVAVIALATDDNSSPRN